MAVHDNARTSLPNRLVAYACLDYAARSGAPRHGGSIALARLANEPGGPGRAFRLRKPEIANALADVASAHEDLTFVEGIGQRSLAFARDPQAIAWDVLDIYYGSVRDRDGFQGRAEWYRAQPSGVLREISRRQRTDLLDRDTIGELTGALA